MTVERTSGLVYVVMSPDGDVEVLDERPRWDWTASGQTVRVANVNGGDSVVVGPGEHLPECPVPAQLANLRREIAADPTNPYLLGALPEWEHGGDEEAEHCTCGAWQDDQREGA